VLLMSPDHLCLCALDLPWAESVFIQQARVSASQSHARQVANMAHFRQQMV
jgi:hypothetical protein